MALLGLGRVGVAARLPYADGEDAFARACEECGIGG